MNWVGSLSFCFYSVFVSLTGVWFVEFGYHIMVSLLMWGLGGSFGSKLLMLFGYVNVVSYIGDENKQ